MKFKVNNIVTALSCTAVNGQLKPWLKSKGCQEIAKKWKTQFFHFENMFAMPKLSPYIDVDQTNNLLAP